MDIIGSYSLIRFNYPDESQIPEEFRELIGIGKKVIEVDVFGKKWHLSTLEEWEMREINMNYGSAPMMNLEYLKRVDILTFSIVKIEDGSNQYDFISEEKKPILRSILLSLDTKVIDVLYNAYLLLVKKSTEEFMKKYSNILEDISKQIDEQ